VLIPVGRRVFTEPLDTLKLDCRPCGRKSTFGLFRRVEQVVIFVPVFRAGVSYTLKCAMCWSTYTITEEDAVFLMSSKDEPDFSYTPRSTVIGPPGGRQGL